jgi:single-stranded-DNA-specific exonuclease
MASCGELFRKFGGHAAAGGFTFDLANEQAIRAALIDYATDLQQSDPQMWESRLGYDCEIPAGLLSLEVTGLLDDLKPFGHGFEEPRFALSAPIEEIRYFYDKATGEPKHTAVFVSVNGPRGRAREKILFFNQVIRAFEPGMSAKFIVTCARNTWRGNTSLSLMGVDFGV